MASVANSNKYLRKKNTMIIHTFQKTEKTYPNSNYETNITLLLKLNKDNKWKV